MAEATKNPANSAPEVTKESRKRIPMSIPSRKLEVPAIPGYHLYWFLEQNVPRAQQAGYDFVDAGETVLNQQNVGTDKTISGNADLGSRVRVVAGVAENGGAEHLVLMKIREEFYLEDRKAIEKQNASVMEAIFTKHKVMGSDNVSADNQSKRYVKTALFTRAAARKSAQ